MLPHALIGSHTYLPSMAKNISAFNGKNISTFYNKHKFRFHEHVALYDIHINIPRQYPPPKAHTRLLRQRYPPSKAHLTSTAHTCFPRHTSFFHNTYWPFMTNILAFQLRHQIRLAWHKASYSEKPTTAHNLKYSQQWHEFVSIEEHPYVPK